MPLHLRPFGGEDAVHHAVADCPVAPGMVMADHAILAGPECLNRPLGSEVEVVGPKSDDLAPQSLERVPQQEAICRRC